MVSKVSRSSTRFLIQILAVALLAASVSAQSLSIQSPKAGQEVAQKDAFNVSGTASVAPDGNVYAWLFNSQGTSSGGRCRSEVIPVTGSAFQKAFSEYDVGDFTLVLQSLGVDGRYSDGQQTGDGGLFGTSDKNLKCANDAGVAGSTLNAKVGSQILSILQDNALNKAGSDDQGVFKIVQFKITIPSVKLNPCPPSDTGRNLTVSGTTNHADGTAIVVTATGPRQLSPKTVVAAGDTFSATFSVEEIGGVVGTYTITANDLKGTTESAQCQVIPGASPSSSPTPTPNIATPSPPPTPTPSIGSSSLANTPSPSPATPSPPTPSPTPTATPTPMPTPSPSSSLLATPTPTRTPPPVQTPQPAPPRRSPGFDLLLALPALGAAALLYRRR